MNQHKKPQKSKSDKKSFRIIPFYVYFKINT